MAGHRSGEMRWNPGQENVVSSFAEIRSELAPTGKLRATINLGNVVLAQRHGATGALGGVSVDLARELAGRLDVEAELFTFDTAGKTLAALSTGQCDVGFLAMDPVRAAEIDYTGPYVIIEGTYLVPDSSPLRDIDEVDMEGIRIAAGKNTAYDLYLTRALKHAALVHAPSSRAAIELLFAGQADVAAGVRQPLVAAAAERAGFHVMSGRFSKIQQAMAIRKGRSPGVLSFLRAFIEEMKGSGFIAGSLLRSGQGDATIAPPA
jgi:polar amino acid transport system substrate-binding protein